MKTLYVYADFDWLDEPMLVGELGYESLRGSDSYSFKYDNDWLRQYECRHQQLSRSAIHPAGQGHLRLLQRCLA